MDLLLAGRIRGVGRGVDGLFPILARPHAGIRIEQADELGTEAWRADTARHDREGLARLKAQAVGVAHDLGHLGDPVSRSADLGR